MKNILAVFVALSLLLAANLSSAQNKSTLELLETLRDNQTITQDQYDKLKKAAEQESEEKDADTGQAVVIKTEGGLSVSSTDGRFSVEIGGRLQIDAAFYKEDKNPLGNGLEIRRAYLNLEGTMFGDWGYEFSVDFADDAEVKDAFVTNDRLWPVRLIIGQYKEPFSLEELTSSKYLTFMERALPNLFAPGRNIGFGFRAHGNVWTTAAGIFGEGFEDDADDEGDEGWALTGRVTYAPFHSDTRVLHFGAALSNRQQNDEKEVRFRTRPESHITDVRYVNTGKISNVDSVRRANLEFAAVRGPFSIQWEYARADVEQPSRSDLTFDGSYLFFSWFVTGESRDYKFKKGAFGRVKPRKKGGAWELAIRYSDADANDGSVTGGREKNVALGVNWYINKRMRFMANYIFVDNDETADDDGDVVGGDQPRIFQMRYQIDF